MKFKSLVLLLFVASLVLGSATVASADGKALYDGKCVSCHGADGKGKDSVAKMLKVDVAKLNLLGSKKTDVELSKITAEGVKDTKMKGYSDRMTSEEIASVVKYIRSLKK